MASVTDWQTTYRSYTPEELAAEIADLKAQKTLYNQQRIGNQEGSINLDELRSQLTAATLIQQERATATRNTSRGCIEFRGMEI